MREIRFYVNEKGCYICTSHFKGVIARRLMKKKFGWKALEDKFVLHSCDDERCINTDHLRVGTHQENMEDKVERNRCEIMRFSPFIRDKNNELKKEQENLSCKGIATILGVPEPWVNLTLTGSIN